MKKVTLKKRLMSKNQDGAYDVPVMYLLYILAIRTHQTYSVAVYYPIRMYSCTQEVSV